MLWAEAGAGTVGGERQVGGVRPEQLLRGVLEEWAAL